MSMWNEPPSIHKSIRTLNRNIGVIRNLAQYTKAAVNVSQQAFGIGAKSVATGPFMGMQAWNKAVHTVTKDSGNRYHIALMTSNVLVDDISTNSVTLHFIDGTVNDGQIVRLRAQKGKTLLVKAATTLDGTTGNIYLDSDITLHENEFLDLTYYNDLGTNSQGMYGQEKGGSGGSGFVNPAIVDLNMNNFNVLNAGEITFANSSIDSAVRSISFTSNGIRYYTDATAGAVNLQHTFWIGLNEMLSISATEIDIFQTTNLEGHEIANVQQMTFSTTASNLIKISTNGVGTEIDMYLAGFNSVSISTNQTSTGIMQMFSKGIASYKTVSTKVSITNFQIGEIRFDAFNTSSNEVSFAGVSAVCLGNNAGIESGRLQLNAVIGGVFTEMAHADQLGWNFDGHKLENFAYNLVQVSGASYTAQLTDRYIMFTDTTFPRNVTLPVAAFSTGFRFTIMHNSTSGGTHVNVITQLGDTINGLSSVSLFNRYDYVTVFSDGNNWMVEASKPTV